MAVVDAEPDSALEEAVRGRERAEAELRETQQRLRTLLRGLPVMLIAVDGDGIVTALEGHTLPDLGVRPSELVGKSIFAYRDDPAFQARWRRVLNGETFTELVDMRAPGIYHELHYAPLRDDAGRFAGAIAVGVDVTERRRAEERRRESAAQLHTLIRNAPVTLIAADTDGIYTRFDGQRLQAVGMRPGELVGESIHERLADRPEIIELWRRAWAGEELSTEARSNDGRRIYELHLFPIRDTQGR